MHTSLVNSTRYKIDPIQYTHPGLLSSVTMHNCAYYKINFINLLKILNDHLKRRHQSAEVLLKSISVSVHTTLVNSMRFKINSIQNIHPGLIFSAVLNKFICYVVTYAYAPSREDTRIVKGESIERGGEGECRGERERQDERV